MKLANITLFFSVILAMATGCRDNSQNSQQPGCRDSVYILNEVTRVEQYTCAPDQDISVPTPKQVMCICRKEYPISAASSTPPQIPQSPDPVEPVDTEVSP